MSNRRACEQALRRVNPRKSAKSTIAWRFSRRFIIIRVDFGMFVQVRGQKLGEDSLGLFRFLFEVKQQLSTNN